ncbi:MAG: ECF RNA polymerase sigma factor SigW [Vicingaceae bacterium]|jgi:RNA polymerase sigma-70 factor (ECF subfamily)|nr:MAG: ECF RNA polymerase sigma factor SigW [Vicingaceae bacterium]
MDVNENFSDKAKRDFQLVQKALDGDQKAYAALLKIYKEQIYFMMLKMVKNPDDAEDLTIEAFGKAFQRLNQYTPTYAFSTWLFKIAVNNCIDFIRKQKMQTFSIDQTYEDDEGQNTQFELKSHESDPEEKLIIKQKNKQMREFVDQLKPRYRNLILLRYFEELSYEEISQRLNLPMGTVKAQLFRAKELLMNIVQKKSKDI